MSTAYFHLNYSIARRTPPSQKILREISEAQSRVNERCSWTYERLALMPCERRNERPQFVFPVVRFTPKPALPEHLMNRVDAGPVTRYDDAAAVGSTKVRSLWDAHKCASFLKHISASYPELVVTLRDDTGFVQAGAVTFRAGKIELDRAWLNNERQRALEITGDPNAAAPYVWAENEALQGRFFLEAPAADFADVPEMRQIGATWDELQEMSLEDLADNVVNRAVTETSPAVA
jgi:hypothetical protein